MNKSKSGIIILGLIISFYLFNGIQYLRSQSITSDEGSFYDYAKRYLKGNPERIDPRIDNSKMPVVVLNTIPRLAQQIINPHLEKKDWGVSDIMMGRYITLLISVFTILLVYKWSNELYGNRAALFASFLMAFCPNNLANAALVTTDSYSVLFLLITMYCLWKFCNTEKLKYFLLLSVFAALSQLVKQSLFHLYVIIAFYLCFYYLTATRKKFNSSKFIKYFLLFLFINWLIINAGYYFHGTNYSLGEYHFMSDLFKTVQNTLPSWLPLPLPKPFIDGLDMAKYYDQVGGGYDKISSFGKVTILGKSATGGSFWYYYFVSIFYKTPITYLILFIATAIFIIRSTTRKSFFKNEFLLLVPVLYFLILFSFFYKTQCGIRHIIFIFPFIFIFSSGIIPSLKNLASKLAVSALSIFLVISVLKYWKNYYPYTNELILHKEMAYWYVGAGNLEFLQGNYFLKNYLGTHPEIHLAPETPQAGTFIINTEDYLDVWNRHKYSWLEKYKPSGEVAYNWLLITVPKSDVLPIDHRVNDK